MVLTVIRLLPLIAPLSTSLPSSASTGRLSRADVSRVVLPVIIMPSSGTLSYGLTSMILPISTLSAGTICSAPSTIIVAVSGRMFASFSMSRRDASTARSSKISPIEKRIVTIAASTKSPRQNAAITATAISVVSSILSFRMFFAPLMNTL